MENLRGILFMTAAMGGFALEDMFVKGLADVMPIGQILFLIGAIGAAVFWIWARIDGHALFTRDLLEPRVMLRNVSELLSAIFYVTAITQASLSSASAIIQATPLAVTLGAAMFLSEPVGWRRWTAILIGFLGVMIIIRPGMSGFEPASLWALASVVVLAMRDVTTRVVPKDIGSTQLAFYAFAIVALGGALMLVVGPAPNSLQWSEILRLLGAVTFSVLGYYALVLATRSGDMSAITPFRYTRLIFALVIGILVFDEQPDLWTILGALIIIGSGLYTLAREQRARRRTLSSATDAG